METGGVAEPLVIAFRVAMDDELVDMYTSGLHVAGWHFAETFSRSGEG